MNLSKGHFKKAKLYAKILQSVKFRNQIGKVPDQGKMKRESSYLLALIDEYKNSKNASGLFTLSICYTKLDMYQQAQRHFNYVLRKNRKSIGYQLFISSAQIEKLPEIFILAGEPYDFLETLNIQVKKYKTDSKGKSPMALYAYALANLIQGKLDHVDGYLNSLETSNLKDIRAIGLSLKALVEKNQHELNSALNLLCLAHRDRVRYGNLKEAAEGFICLPATVISVLAAKGGMNVTVESDYLPLGYTKYLTSL